MNIVKRTRNDRYPGYFNIFEDFFNETFPEIRFNDVKSQRMPSVNIGERDTRFEIDLAAPGFQKEDFSIDVHDAILTVKGEKKEEKTDEDKKYTRREYSFSSFERSFTLPENIDDESIDAKYENGVLRIILPKTETKPEDNKRKIEIK